MKRSMWPSATITTKNGQVVQGIAPLIISASRATDIPALFAPWFFEQLARGYIAWVNPFNRTTTYIALHRVRLVVFWSKNVTPLLPYLKLLQERDIRYCFQLTVNDYELEHFEPGIPPLSDRIDAVKACSDLAGRERVLWRFDPMVLTPELTVPLLLQRIERIGNQLAPFVSRLTVSFLSPYPTVIRRMNRRGITLITPEEAAFEQIGRALNDLKNRWKIDVVSCAEAAPLDRYGVARGSCIDPVYIARVFGDDPELMQLLYGNFPADLFNEQERLRDRLKDRGQRPRCRCMISKDIGSYATCTQGCVYCYAQNR